MTDQSFSERHDFAPSPERVPYDQVPPWVRSELVSVLEEFAWKRGKGDTLRDSLYKRLKPLIRKVLKTKPPGSPMGGLWNYYIPQLKDKPIQFLRWLGGDSPWKYYGPRLIKKCQWWQVYDICEQIYEVVGGICGEGGAEIFAQEVNDLFTREHLVWRFKDGRIERAYSPHIAREQGKVHTLLEDPRFQGADQQFKKALNHLNKRPDPDTENCVKDAVGAVEATARIICGDHTVTLNKILDKEPFRSRIHGSLRGTIEKLYAYRGDVGGVAHGQVGPSQVALEEAEYVLTVAAATIVYLVKKFGEPRK